MRASLLLSSLLVFSACAKSPGPPAQVPSSAAPPARVASASPAPVAEAQPTAVRVNAVKPPPSWNDVADVAIVRAVIPSYEPHAKQGTTFTDCRGNTETPLFPSDAPVVARYPLTADRIVVWVVVGRSYAACDMRHGFYSVLRLRDGDIIDVEASMRIDINCEEDPKARPFTIASGANSVDVILVEAGETGDEGLSTDAVKAMVVRDGKLLTLGTVMTGWFSVHPFDDSPDWETSMRGTPRADPEGIVVEEDWTFTPERIPGAAPHHATKRRVYRLSGDVLAPTTKDDPPAPPIPKSVSSKP